MGGLSTDRIPGAEPPDCAVDGTVFPCRAGSGGSLGAANGSDLKIAFDKHQGTR